MVSETKYICIYHDNCADGFGRECNLELGVPTDHNAKRIFTVSWELAVPVIKTHIANKVAELNELNIIAKAQLETV